MTHKAPLAPKAVGTPRTAKQLAADTARRALPGRSKSEKRPPVARGEVVKRDTLLTTWSPR